MHRTQKQNITLHVLLHKLSIDQDQKEELVSDYTNGRTVRSSEMTIGECDRLIATLTEIDGDKLDRKRKRIIAHLKEIGYDMPGIYKWVKTQTGKHFNSLNSQELSGTIHAAQRIRDHYLSKVNDARTV